MKKTKFSMRNFGTMVLSQDTTTHTWTCTAGAIILAPIKACSLAAIAKRAHLIVDPTHRDRCICESSPPVVSQ
jgi:hypothetical protein